MAVNTPALNEECEVGWEQDLKGFARVKQIIFEVIHGEIWTQG